MNREQRRAGQRGQTEPAKRDVAVGFCYAQSTVTPQWRRCYTLVIVRDAATNRRIVGEFAQEVSGVHIPHGRCEIVRQFLNHPAKPDWLWIIDTDATFADDILERLLAVADAQTRPIVGALAFGVRPAKNDDGTFVLNSVMASPLDLFPTIYTWNDDGTCNNILNYPRDQLVQCTSTGAHCLLIHRRVLEDDRWQDGHPNPWFRTAVAHGREVSEDQYFCLKAGTLGYPIHVDTRVKTGHVKSFIADEDYYTAQRAAFLSPEPWIVVPTGGRDEYLAGIVAAAPDRTVIVATSGTTRQIDSAVTVTDDGEINIHRWWNTGIAEAMRHGARYVAIVNDDITISRDDLIAMRDQLVRTGATLCRSDLERMTGWAFMLDTSHGVYPDNVYRWWFGDNDLELRAQFARGLTATETGIVHHHPNETTEADPRLQRLAAADRRTFERRWPEVQLRAS